MSKARSEKEPFKVLSIGQPWAELILRRRKPFEIRTWGSNYRGRLLIHASKKWNAAAAQELGISKDHVNLGEIVGVAELACIRHFTKADARLLYKKKGGNGDWEGGSYAWVLKSVCRIKPIPFKGQLGLFTAPASIRRKVEAEMAAKKAARAKRRVERATLGV